MMNGAFKGVNYAFFILIILSSCTKNNSDQPAFALKNISTLEHELFQADQELNPSALRLNLIHAYLLHERLRQQGQDEKADQVLEIIALRDPASPHLQIQLSQRSLQKGELAKAEEFAHRAYALAPHDVEIQFEYASVLMATDRHSEALAILEKLYEAEPSNENYLNALLEIDLRRADYWVAMRRLKLALKDSESPEYIHYRMGRIFREMGQMSESRQEFEMALKINPTFYQATTYLAIAYEEAGEELKALELFEGLASLTNNPLYHRKLAALYVKKKEFAKAIDAYKNLIQLEPNDMNSLLQMARVWIELGEFESSEANFKEMIRLEPGNGALHLMMGMLLEAQSKTEEALQHYLKIQADSTAYFDSMALRFKAFYKLNQKQQLLEQLEQSLVFASTVEEEVKSQSLFKVISEYYAELGLWEQSVDVLKRGLARFPTNEILLFRKGILLEKQGQAKESIKTMLSILSLNPDHVGALNFVGYSWAEQGVQLPEAKQMILKALELEPNDPYITDSLGWVLYKMGRYEEAYEQLFKSYRSAPNEFVVIDHLGDVLVKLGRLSEARSYYAKALQFKPEKPEQLQSVQAKLDQIENKLPLETRVGQLEVLCEGMANRRCTALRLRHENTEERSPAAKAE